MLSPRIPKIHQHKYIKQNIFQLKSNLMYYQAFIGRFKTSGNVIGEAISGMPLQCIP